MVVARHRGSVSVPVTARLSQVDWLVADGRITNKDVVDAPQALLRQAGAACDRGIATAAENALGAFVRLVSAQSLKGTSHGARAYGCVLL